MERVAQVLHEQGRLCWTALSLLAPVDAEDETAGSDPDMGGDVSCEMGGLGSSDGIIGEREPFLHSDLLGSRQLSPPAIRRSWRRCQPDVFSLRRTSRPDALDVTVHEIKVCRSDLLAELRNPRKTAAYAAVSGSVWWVLAAGIADPDEIPEAFGVLIAHPERLELARTAPVRPHVLAFSTWMALAASSPWRSTEEASQASLIEVSG